MVILDDRNCRESLLPFSATRHVAEIRIGILTIREKWEKLTGEKVSIDPDDHGIAVPANLIPSKENYQFILATAEKKGKYPADQIRSIEYPWQIFMHNDYALRADYEILTAGRVSAVISKTNTLIHADHIFIEEGAVAEYSILNATEGPIYIDKGAEIMEGNLIRGPFSLGKNSALKMGSRIYGATTIGPNCVAGGEIKNSVIFANSNKAHGGYLGHSVIGEWCNLGAGTSNSNVKNTGGEIGYISKKKEKRFAGNKAGLLMGDYSRCSINTSFNTGTIAGVCANIFGEIMPPKFIPDFAWGTERYDFEKAVAHISNWKKMKGQELSEKEITILKNIYDSE